MTPTRESNTSPIDVEAQGDPEERWRNAAREVGERINAYSPGSPEHHAYDQLKALMGEGSLQNALVAMLRQGRTNKSLLAADKKRKGENASAISKLRSLKSLFEQRQKRAIADARVNTFFDLTFPLGFIRELPNAIAYFEGDDPSPSGRPSARQAIGLGKQSGGGANPRSRLSIIHAAVGRCAEEIHGSTSENCDEAIGILAAMMFDLKDATAYDVAKWRQQWVDAKAYPEPGDDEIVDPEPGDEDEAE